MSLLQSYETHRKILGNKKIDAIQKYIDFLHQSGLKLEYSDIIYNKFNFEKFEDWYRKNYED